VLLVLATKQEAICNAAIAGEAVECIDALFALESKSTV
jgi:hypothetical protein